MNDRQTRAALASVAVVMVGMAIVYAIAQPKAERGPMPDDPIAIAHRLAAHPDDWEAASALTEHALDARVPSRIALWRAASEAAIHLAPNRDAPRMALARAVFFHWTEMSAADHAAALNAIAPLLRDPSTFFRMAEPLFELTGDLTMLRRWQPGTAQATALLIELALPNGKFDDYRALRQQLVERRYAELAPKLPHLSPAEIIQALPSPPYTSDQQPLLVAVLNELHRRPLDEDPHVVPVVDGLIDYVLRHHLRPIDGLEFVAKTPAASDPERLALANELGLAQAALQIRTTMTAPSAPPANGTWQGPDADRWMTREFDGPASIAIQRTMSDEVPPYVEIFIDDVRVAEGTVPDVRNFALPPMRGMHRLDVRLANPITRNRAPRRIAIVSVGP